ncbi:hypothetical protein FGG08_002111 [Glutinoglossum americanum]|uniref:amidase n=1 Tax=Glutinoglossum americanum TaxID=1670608 RepID=A0A9P8L203_9PEZI|nr:hypothetical protein FGG08_002111 [Glutinoglossum americanum]
MVFLVDYFQHRRDCKWKQRERDLRIATLPAPYLGSLSALDKTIHGKSVEELVQDVHKDVFKPIDILRAYGKVAVKAHEKTNCLTEVMIAEAEGWAENEINLKGPLAGIPVSLKDSIIVSGFDSSVAYSSNTRKPHPKDGSLVRLLKDAGGEAALLALGGGRIGIGSDVAGSVRVPAHFSGIYSLRCSTGRWPKMGASTSMPGQDGIPSVFSPMARTLGDLAYFTRSLLAMKPWKYDHTVHPIGWREDQEKDAREKNIFRVGVLEDDGVVTPSPACARALQIAVSALKADGHELITVNPPPPYEALVIASQLLNSDGCETFSSFLRAGEWNDPGAAQMSFYMRIPRPIKYLYYLWVRYVRRDEVWAGLLRDWHEKSALEYWKLIGRREAYKIRWHEWWEQEAKLDFLITVPNATPAVPHDGMKQAVSSCGYTFLFNLLDYTAGVLPVTHVDRSLDQLPSTFRLRDLNGVAQGAYIHYDADKMHGLPVGVQVVGQRLEEEKVLALMGRVEEAMEKWVGGKYELLEVD